MGKNFDDEYDEQETNLFDFLRECVENEENDTVETSDKDRKSSVLCEIRTEQEHEAGQSYMKNEDSVLYADDADDCSNYYIEDLAQNDTKYNYIDYEDNYSAGGNERKELTRNRNDRPHTFSLTFVIIMTAVITAAAVIAGFATFLPMPPNNCLMTITATKQPTMAIQ